MSRLEEYDWILINEIAFRIHSTKDETQMRTLVLQYLSRAIQFDLASFYLISTDGPDFIGSSPVYWNFDPQAVRLYSEYGEAIDFKKWNFFNRKHSAYRERDFLSPEEFQKTEIYQCCYRPLGIQHSARMLLFYSDAALGFLSLYRKAPAQEFADRELHILDQLHDHLAYRLYENRADNAVCAKDAAGDIAAEYGFTGREAQVFGLVLQGLDNAAIAQALCVSPNTLKKYIGGIYNKMGISGRVQLLQAVKRLLARS